MSERRRSFDEFFERDYPALRRLAFRLTADWGLAENLTLDAFVRTRRSWHRISHDEDPALAARRELASLYLSPLRIRRRGRSSGSPRLRVALALDEIEHREEWAIAQIFDCEPDVAARLVDRARSRASDQMGPPRDPEPDSAGAMGRFERQRGRANQMRALALSIGLAVAGTGTAVAKSSSVSQSSALLHAPAAAPASWRAEHIALIGYTIRHPRNWLAIIEGESMTLRPTATRHGEDPRSDFALRLNLGEGRFDVRQTPLRARLRGWAYSTDRVGRAYAFDLGERQSLVATLDGRGASLGQFRKPALAILSTLRRDAESRVFANELYRITIPESWIGRRYPRGNGALESAAGTLTFGPADIGAGGVDPDLGIPRGWFQLEFHFYECDCGLRVEHADFADGTTTDGKPFRREERSLRSAKVIHFKIDWNRVTADPACRNGCKPPGTFITLEATIIGSASVFDRYVDAAESIVASIRDANAVDHLLIPNPSVPPLFMP